MGTGKREGLAAAAAGGAVGATAAEAAQFIRNIVSYHVYYYEEGGGGGEGEGARLLFHSSIHSFLALFSISPSSFALLMGTFHRLYILTWAGLR